MTSAQAAKLIRKLTEEKELLLSEEKESREFIAAIQEDVETVRPAYNFSSMQEKIAALDQKIRAVKHALNIFNTTQTVLGFNMTIDEMLIYLPQLRTQKEKLEKMAKRLEKKRITSDYGRSGNLIEYSYANYNIEEVRKKLEEVSDELSRAQTALDVVNNQVEVPTL
ncbi:MAG: hypothetical protein IJI45_03435 [Anaerolineaceae bacterium]|nr:hypothetical protein [Anaerolineaceae bacterium]